MKYRPSLSFVVVMSMLAVSGVGGAWAWTKVCGVPRQVRAEQGFWGALTYKEKKRVELPELTPEERRQMKDRVDGAIAAFEKEFPVLDTEERPVPDDVNGYRLIHELMDPEQSSQSLGSKELAGLVAEKDRWDPVRLKVLLAEHAELVGKIEHIASLPTRSSTHMPENYIGFISARSGKTSAEILLAKARLAAEAGDEQEALRQVAATLNFARHYVEIEEPSLLGETVTILIEQQVQQTFLTKLLPALGKSADLAAWKRVLAPRDLSTAHWAELMRAEWHLISRHWLMPFLLDERREDNPPDARKLLQIYTEHWAGVIGRCDSIPLAELLNSGPSSLPDLSSLSPRSREYAKLVMVGSDTWSLGYLRHARITAQHRAALELMIAESSGDTLTSASTEKVTKDPLDGSAFSYNPANRTLTSPPVQATHDPVEVVLPSF